MSECQDKAEAAAGESWRGCFCGGAGPAFSEWLRRMGPPETAREHFVKARVEFLKGIRELIDARIADLSRAKEKGEKVTVE